MRAQETKWKFRNWWHNTFRGNRLFFHERSIKFVMGDLLFKSFKKRKLNYSWELPEIWRELGIVDLKFVHQTDGICNDLVYVTVMFMPPNDNMTSVLMEKCNLTIEQIQTHLNIWGDMQLVDVYVKFEMCKINDIYKL